MQPGRLVGVLLASAMLYGWGCTTEENTRASRGEGSNRGGAGGVSEAAPRPGLDAASGRLGVSGGATSQVNVSNLTTTPEPLTFVLEPTFEGNDNDAVPQVGVLRLQTNIPATVAVTVSGGDEEWPLSLPADTAFEVPIVGLAPATPYTLSLVVSAGQRSLIAGPLQWTTPALPADFPPIDVVRSESELMEPGMTLFNVRATGGTDSMVIVDHAGVVRWYHASAFNPVPEDHRRLTNGHFLFITAQCSVQEVDLRGHLVGAWQAANFPYDCPAPPGSTQVPVTSFHHEISVLPDGRFLTLCTESRVVDDFPTSETDASAPAETALVVSSAIVEFARDGEVLKSISLLDLLDPTRIGRDSLNTASLEFAVGADEEARDWGHANAVVYDEASDSYYVSLRHQDAVIKVNRTTESLTWILGTHSNWKAPWREKLLEPVGDVVWPYHQHAVELTPMGLGLYDNGNYRAAAFETPQTQYSRVAAYAVDEQAMTVSEVWAYGDAEGQNSFFSAAMGDADWQAETGNVLMVNSVLRTRLGSFGQILEVTPDGTPVFELNIRGNRGDAFSIYRAQRLLDIRR